MAVPRFTRAFPDDAIHIWPLDDGRMLLHIANKNGTSLRLTYSVGEMEAMFAAIRAYQADPTGFKGCREFSLDDYSSTPEGETKQEDKG